MKYVILIHSNPVPWDHPTQLFTTEGRALPPERHAEMDRQFDALMEEIAGTDVPDWTLHDIRRTVAAGMQRIGVKMEVTEKILNHVSGSFHGIAGIYQVHDYADEKRLALDAWGNFVMTLVSGATESNVVPIRLANS